MNSLSNSLDRFSDSEKRLIVLALILGLCFGLWQFLVKPVLSAKAAVGMQYQTALRDYDIVQRALPAIAPNNTNASDLKAFDRSALIATARAVDIPISRVQPFGNDKGSQVWFDQTSTEQVYNFLQSLKREYAVEIVSAQINRQDEGRVSAQFSFVALN